MARRSEEERALDADTARAVKLTIKLGVLLAREKAHTVQLGVLIALLATYAIEDGLSEEVAVRVLTAAMRRMGAQPGAQGSAVQ